MRFMVMHKVDATMEAGERPSKTIIQEMGKLVGRSLEAGIFKDGAGLHRSAARARVKRVRGNLAVEHGPYSGDNELLASFALVSTNSGIEPAIELAKELAETADATEIEVGPVVERWDLHGGSRPANTPYRFLLLVKADAAFEAGERRKPEVDALFERWKRDGVLQSHVSLRPSQGALRSKVVDGARRWIDGPFAESKELVAGFSILEVESIEDAKRFTEEYAAILGENEVDVREVAV